MDTPNERNLALFIDFDNIAIGLRESRKNGFEIRLVLDRLLEKGRIIAKKAYADKTTLKQAAVALGYLTAEQFDEWVKPVEMTRPNAD